MEDLTAKEKQKIILSVLKMAGNRHIKKPLESENKYSKSKKQPGKKAVITTNDPKNPLGIKIGISGKFFYLRFAEFGTKPRFTYNRAMVYKSRKSGKKSKGRIQKTSAKAFRGIMPVKQNLRSAIESNIENVVNYIAENYGKITARRMKALANKKSN
jgi:HK97 gp10 family phage protein